MIDIAAQKELRRIDVSPLSRPHGLAFVNGKLYFTAEADKKIARYDPARDQIDWQFETGQATTHMVLPTRDATTIFTSNIGSDSVSAIQQGANGVWTQTVIPVGKGPEGIDLSPNGREVWSAHSRDGGVSIIDVSVEEGRADDRHRHEAIEPDQADARRRSSRSSPISTPASWSSLDAPARKVITAHRARQVARGHPDSAGRRRRLRRGERRQLHRGRRSQDLAGDEEDLDRHRPRRHGVGRRTLTPVIQVSGIRKTYGATVAVDDVSFDVARRRDLRPDRAERRRQDDDDGVRRGRCARPDRGTHLGARARSGPRRLRSCRSGSACSSSRRSCRSASRCGKRSTSGRRSTAKPPSTATGCSSSSASPTSATPGS